MAKLQSRLFEWRAVIAHSDLPPTTRLVAHTLALHMSATGESCFPSTETLSRESGLSARAVFKHLRVLRESGYLITAPREGTTSLYFAADPSQSATPPLHEVHTPLNEVQIESVTERVSLSSLRSERALSLPKDMRDAIWDALVAGFGEPATDAEKKKLGKVAKGLWPVLASFEPAAATREIERRIEEARRRFHDLDFTAFVLLSRWSDLGGRSDQRSSGRARYGTNLSAGPSPSELKEMRRRQDERVVDMAEAKETWRRSQERQNAMEAVMEAARDAGRDPEEAVKAWVAENP